MSGAFDAIGAALRGLVNAGNQALPSGLFFAALFVVALAVGWVLVKR